VILHIAQLEPGGSLDAHSELVLVAVTVTGQSHFHSSEQREAHARAVPTAFDPVHIVHAGLEIDDTCELTRAARCGVDLDLAGTCGP
jgi:hypothetical protein